MANWIGLVMKNEWKREGATVYALNEQGTNIFSFGVMPGYTYQTRHDCERTTVDETVAIAELARSAPELLEALSNLLNWAYRNSCQHDETHRGGALWEICDQCGAKWADDEGGKPEWKEPKELLAADAAIEKAKAIGK